MVAEDEDLHADHGRDLSDRDRPRRRRHLRGPARLQRRLRRVRDDGRPDAAKRGLVAAAVHYDSRIAHFCGCTGSENWKKGVAVTSDPLDCEAPDDGWDDKARAVFDNADAASALRRIVSATATRAAKASLGQGHRGPGSQPGILDGAHGRDVHHQRNGWPLGGRGRADRHGRMGLSRAGRPLPLCGCLQRLRCTRRGGRRPGPGPRRQPRRDPGRESERHRPAAVGVGLPAEGHHPRGQALGPCRHWAVHHHPRHGRPVPAGRAGRRRLAGGPCHGPHRELWWRRPRLHDQHQQQRQGRDRPQMARWLGRRAPEPADQPEAEPELAGARLGPDAGVLQVP